MSKNIQIIHINYPTQDHMLSIRMWNAKDKSKIGKKKIGVGRINSYKTGHFRIKAIFPVHEY